MIDKVSVPFKYREQEILDELFDYLAGTYKSHYVGDDNVQAMDLIISSGHGVGFTVGDIIKYGARYGKKKGQERTDILKIIHYAIFLLYIHDKNEERKAREANLDLRKADQKGFLPPPKVTDLPKGLIESAEHYQGGVIDQFAPLAAGAARLTKNDPVAKAYVESKKPKDVDWVDDETGTLEMHIPTGEVRQKKPEIGDDPVTALHNEYGSSR